MLPLGPRVRALFMVAVLVGASALLLGGETLGLSGGIDEALDKQGGATVTLLEGGCSCHNPAYTGTVKATLEGVPAFWSFKDKVETGPFNLTVRITGGPDPSPTGAQGGFNLQVSQGTLQVPEGKDDVQVLDGQATHTSKGNRQRNWTLQWVPPTAAGPDALFTLTVNSVDGNGAPAPPDAWGRATYLALGKTRASGGGAAAGGEVEQVTSLGVNFYAYWVGVVSFVVLFVVLAATFFLLRYGETQHWSDWKDRPARDKGEAARKSSLGTWVVLGVVLVVFAVAAVQVLRLV